MFWGCFRHNGCLDVFICVSVFLAAHGGCGGVIPGGVRQRMLQYWAGVFDETMGSVSYLFVFIAFLKNHCSHCQHHHS